MKILVDTHIFLWAAASPERLSAKHLDLLESRSNMIFVSAVSVAEIAIKVSLKKLEFNADINEQIEAAGFEPLAFKGSDASLLADLPFHHKDPFDRMLIAQAQNRGLKLMSEDSKFQQYACELL